jgi:putative membrane protein
MGSEAAGELQNLQAAERTLLAWVRTTLALMGAGMLIARFGLSAKLENGPSPAQVDQPANLGMWIGATLLILASIATLLAVNKHIRFVKAIAAKKPITPNSRSLSVFFAAGIGLLGVGLALCVLLMRRHL